MDEKKLLILLQELIRIESVNPELVPGGAGEKQIAKFIENHLKKLGVETKTQRVSKDRFNVIGILRGSGRGNNLILNGHMDTVGITGMDIPPLKADFKEGKVFGRGSADMKSGLAAMLAACETVSTERTTLQGDVLFTFVVDEEFKSAGTEKLLDSFSAQAAVVCEPTDLKIGLSHKGFVWARVSVTGKAAHGSRPEEGVDAIVKAGKLLTEIEKLDKGELTSRSHPLLGHPSLHASMISGGQELSTYPDRCTIQLERRTIPGEDAGTFERELGEIIDRLRISDPEFEARWEIVFSRPPLETPGDEPVVKSLRDSAEKVLKQKCPFRGISWWMDSALFQRAGIPAVTFGPAGNGLHSAVEYVNFKSVVDTAAILVRTITDFCDARK